MGSILSMLSHVTLCKKENIHVEKVNFITGYCYQYSQMYHKTLPIIFPRKCIVFSKIVKNDI